VALFPARHVRLWSCSYLVRTEEKHKRCAFLSVHANPQLPFAVIYPPLTPHRLFSSVFVQGLQAALGVAVAVV